MGTLGGRTATGAEERRLLYVAAPGIRDYLEYGGHGLLVFDIDDGHRFVKRIPTAGLDEKGKPLNVKGVCASAATKRIYISTTKTLTCLDLVTEKVLWERAYPGGCDRMAISPDGKVIYLPSLERRPLARRRRPRRRRDRQDRPPIRGPTTRSMGSTASTPTWPA